MRRSVVYTDGLYVGVVLWDCILERNIKIIHIDRDEYNISLHRETIISDISLISWEIVLIILYIDCCVHILFYITLGILKRFRLDFNYSIELELDRDYEGFHMVRWLWSYELYIFLYRIHDCISYLASSCYARNKSEISMYIYNNLFSHVIYTVIHTWSLCIYIISMKCKQ